MRRCNRPGLRRTWGCMRRPSTPLRRGTPRRRRRSGSDPTRDRCTDRRRQLAAFPGCTCMSRRCTPFHLRSRRRSGRSPGRCWRDRRRHRHNRSGRRRTSRRTRPGCRPASERTLRRSSRNRWDWTSRRRTDHHSLGRSYIRRLHLPRCQHPSRRRPTRSRPSRWPCRRASHLPPPRRCPLPHWRRPRLPATRRQEGSRHPAVRRGRRSRRREGRAPRRTRRECGKSTPSKPDALRPHLPEQGRHSRQVHARFSSVLGSAGPVHANQEKDASPHALRMNVGWSTADCPGSVESERGTREPTARGPLATAFLCVLRSR